MMLANVLDVIQQKSGTHLKDARLERTRDFVVALANHDDHTLESIYTTLTSEPLSHPLWHQVIQQITVGETYFFRNRGHFDALRECLLPKLINERRERGQKFLRIWIAGCATGEEPYSIAMLLQQLISDIHQWSIFILASDINAAFLEFAKDGIYTRRAFRNETPPYIQGQWFTEVDGRYQIANKIKRMVTFMPHNLVDTDYPSLKNNTASLDLILCRNVTIYFDRDTTQQIVNRLHDALRTGGWLIVGHSEPQPRVYDAFSMKTAPAGVIFYQKPEPMNYDVQATESEQTKPVPPPSHALRISEALNKKDPQKANNVNNIEAINIAIQSAFDAADREDWKHALAILDTVEQMDQYNPLLHYIRGLVWTHQDNPRSAIQAFRQAVYCEPDFALAHYALGELFYQQQDRNRALQAWRQSQKALSRLKPESLVLGASDLTVEMLNDLLAYRLA